MNIALVNRVFSLSHGGRERYGVNLASALQNMGCRVTAVGTVLNDLPAAIQTVRVDAARHPRWWGPLSLQRAVHRSLEKKSFDLVYGLSPCPPLDIYRLGDGIHRHWMHQRYPDPVQKGMYSLLRPVHLVNLFLERSLFEARKCSRFIVNSRLCGNQLQDYYGVAPDKIRIVYNGVDRSSFSSEAVSPLRKACRGELGLSSTDLAVLFVAHDWRRKGLEVLVEAIARLGEKGKRFHLVIVGRGKPGRYRLLAKSLGLEDRLHVVGPVSSIHPFYGAGDLLVLPTRYDPFANACLEAMACGLPVITTTANGAAELVAQGRNGYVQQRYEDAEELARYLNVCLDRETLSIMGRAAEDTARAFTLEANASDTMDFMRDLIIDRKRDPEKQ